MKPTEDKYPVFEANQVLTNEHLNQAINYLDEQERLTRANLIGIGIECGLEMAPDNSKTKIFLSKGCGITSEGYLIVEPDNLILENYRPYELPPEISYLPFKYDEGGASKQYSLWEMLPADQSSGLTKALDFDFLKDKAVLLFLELKKSALRNCGPNNCDDKGSAVTATVKRLLISQTDLDKIIAATNKPDSSLSFVNDYESLLNKRLGLPDVRLPRYHVPNAKGLSTSNDILAAFLSIFQTNTLASSLSNALSAAFMLFKPVLQDSSIDPSVEFFSKFSFLENTPTNEQIAFLPYYYDFFDDLIRAYDEFRWQGLELMCACCPPNGLFPRHLMLGSPVSGQKSYRHHFFPSSANIGCESAVKELRLLFQRLVQMIASFKIEPPLQVLPALSLTPIRITPSKLGDVKLSEKAIPYYYQQNGNPPLYKLWDAEKTKKNRADQNLSYRSKEYNAPQFITDALSYDLEPYNFLRIEGHLGQNYQSVLQKLLAQKSKFRLPIQIIALRAGAFDDNIIVDLDKEDCRFQDLETLYDILKAELSCFLCDEVQYFYDLPHKASPFLVTGTVVEPTFQPDQPTKPKLGLLVQYAPDFLVKPDTLGRFFEDWVDNLPEKVIPNFNINNIIHFLTTHPLNQINSFIIYIIIYISKLFDQLAQDLGQLNFVNFEQRYHDLANVTVAIEQAREKTTDIIKGSDNLLNWEELDDRLEAIIYYCHLEAFRALQEEYKRRIKEVKQKQFFSFFLQNNPGIQHKAGVPMGGTFILVYHENMPKVTGTPVFAHQQEDKGTTVSIDNQQPVHVGPCALSELAYEAALRLQSYGTLSTNPDFQILINELTELGAIFPTFDFGILSEIDKKIARTVNGFKDGTVIADFYVPYLCCSDCSPVQFVLPKIPPTFTLEVGCTSLKNQSPPSDPSQFAKVALTPEGGLPPYTLILDGVASPAQVQDKTIIFEIQSDDKSHTIAIQDAEGTKSTPQTITIAKLFCLGEPQYVCYENGAKYKATMEISGGVPPYSKSEQTQIDDKEGSIQNNDGSFSYTTGLIDSGTSLGIKLLDSKKCPAIRPVSHICTRPSFTVQIKCIDPTATMRAITIIPSAGQQPYSYLLDAEVTATPLPATGTTLNLAPGDHKLVVIDRDGSTSENQTVNAPGQLDVDTVEYSEDHDNDTYQVSFNINGGTPKYSVNGVEIEGIKYTSLPVKNGGSITVRLTDKNPCPPISKDFTHKFCNLPCNGITIKNGYLFWLPEPDTEHAYQIHAPKVNSFRFNLPGKDKIDITTDVENLFINNLPVTVLKTSFYDLIEGWLVRINKIISNAGNPVLLELSYKPAIFVGTLGTLRMEYFECLDFEFDLSMEIHTTLGNETIIRLWNASYIPNGTILTQQIDNASPNTIKTPAFDGIQTDKCKPEIPQTNLCGKPPEYNLNIEQSYNAKTNTVTLNASVISGPEPVSYLWEIQDAIPSTSSNQNANFTFTNMMNLNKEFRLTAFSKNGCRFFQTGVIILNGQ